MQTKGYTTTTVRLESDLHDRLDQQAQRLGVSKGYLIRRALQEFLPRSERSAQLLADPLVGGLIAQLMQWSSNDLTAERQFELQAVLDHMAEQRAPSASTPTVRKPT